MLGDFLVRNRVLSTQELALALETQKRVGYHLGLLELAETLLGEDELALLYARLEVNDESVEDAIVALELLSPDEIAELKGTGADFRIPLGLILQKLHMLDRAKFKTWLGRFERQKFDQTKLRKQLKKIPIFAPLPARALARLCTKLTYKYRVGGEHIYHSGEKSNGIYIVESGLVRFTVNIKQDLRVTGSCQNGEMFGIPGVLTGSPREENALAITDTVLWRISNADFMRLMREHPQIAEVTARQIGTIYQTSIHHLRHKTKINESRIAVIFFADKSDESSEFAGRVFDSMVKTLPHNSLIINTLPGFTPPGTRGVRRAASPSQVLIRPTRRRDVFYTALRQIEQLEIVDGPSAEWLRQAVNHYALIVLFTKTGTREFRRFVMGLCRRSVTIVRDEFPPHLKFLKPVRDRIYQLSTGSHETDMGNRSMLQSETPGCLIPNLITPTIEQVTAERIARWISGKSVGIAFGGGGARALSHLGVLEVMQKTGVVIDMIAGSSAGAHVGGMVAAGRPLSWIHDYFIHNAVEKRGHPFNDFTFPRLSFIRGKKYHNLLKLAFADKEMALLDLPFFPLVTDLQTGRPVIVQNGRVADAVLASGSVPGIFPPVVRAEGALADGGMINNIPADILKDWDTSFVISINTSIDPGRSLFRPNSIGKIMLQALDIFMVQSVKVHEEHTDFEIKPDVDRFSVTDHRRGQEIIESGRLAARKSLPLLLRALKKNGIL